MSSNSDDAALAAFFSKRDQQKAAPQKTEAVTDVKSSKLGNLAKKEERRPDQKNESKEPTSSWGQTAVNRRPQVDGQNFPSLASVVSGKEDPLAKKDNTVLNIKTSENQFSNLMDDDEIEEKPKRKPQQQTQSKPAEPAKAAPAEPKKPVEPKEKKISKEEQEVLDLMNEFGLGASKPAGGNAKKKPAAKPKPKAKGKGKKK